jgi:hypothetical protein
MQACGCHYPSHQHTFLQDNWWLHFQTGSSHFSDQKLTCPSQGCLCKDEVKRHMTSLSSNRSAASGRYTEGAPFKSTCLKHIFEEKSALSVWFSTRQMQWKARRGSLMRSSILDLYFTLPHRLICLFHLPSCMPHTPCSPGSAWHLENTFPSTI